MTVRSHKESVPISKYTKYCFKDLITIKQIGDGFDPLSICAVWVTETALLTNQFRNLVIVEVLWALWILLILYWKNGCPLLEIFLLSDDCYKQKKYFYFTILPTFIGISVFYLSEWNWI